MVTADDLKLLRARAKRLHGGNLSAAVADGVSRLREEEATHRLLERLGPPPLSDERYEEILVVEWRSGAKPRPGTRKRKRAGMTGLTFDTGVIPRLAGEAIARVRGATPIDAIVMASAAVRGDRVYTSDVSDLEKLRAHFPSVRVLST